MGKQKGSNITLIILQIVENDCLSPSFIRIPSFSIFESSNGIFQSKILQVVTPITQRTSYKSLNNSEMLISCLDGDDPCVSYNFHRRREIFQYLMIPTRRPKDSLPRPKPASSAESKRLIKKVPIQAPTEVKAELKTALKNIQALNDGVLQDAFQNKDLHGALRVLHQIEAAITDCPYQANKRLHFLHLSTFYNNKAFILEELEHDDESCRMMERSLKHYEALLNSLPSREEQVAHSTAFLRLSLRYCALLSHAERHQEAIETAQKCLIKISEILVLLEGLCEQSVDSARGTPQTLATESESRMRSAEKVNFKRIVIRQAKKLLSEVGELPLPDALITQQKEHFQQKIRNMYFWKNNSDNNASSMRKQLQHPRPPTERNLLGLQKSSALLEEFSLSQLMSLDLLKMGAKLNTDAYYLLSGPKIVQLVLMGAVCYFTIATETRFSEGNLDVTTLKISEKYRKLKDEGISRCKILHLKAIEVAGKYLPPDNDFFTHLLNSFNKNYKCLMDEIKEESEISVKEINNEINETYYHRLDESSKFDEPTLANIPKKKRSTSKDREKVVTGLKKKLRSNSISKKV